MGGTSPFPWLVNLGNTCYQNAVLHCLLHCSRLRAHLLSLDAAAAGAEHKDAVAEIVRFCNACPLNKHATRCKRTSACVVERVCERMRTLARM